MDTELSLEQLQGFGGTRMCQVVQCFYYLAQDGQRSHCPTIHPDMGVSALWFIPLVDSIVNVLLDMAVQQDFRVRVLPMRPTGGDIFFERTSVFEGRFESSNEDSNLRIIFALIAIQLNPIESKLLRRIAAKTQEQQRAHQIDR